MISPNDVILPILLFQGPIRKREETCGRGFQRGRETRAELTPNEAPHAELGTQSFHGWATSDQY